jgi:hypothetical protein
MLKIIRINKQSPMAQHGSNNGHQTHIHLDLDRYQAYERWV